MLELSSTTLAQASPVQTLAVSGTGTNAIRLSGSATSTGYVSRSNDGSLLTFTGHNNTDTSANANTLNPRAVVAFSSDGTFTLPTTYTGGSGNQTRGATTLNNSTWFIGDQGGLYTNASTAASPTGNFRNARAYGGVVYVSSATAIATVAAASGSTAAALPGLPALASAQDFYLIRSGSNGTTFDVLYVLSATSNTAGSISKFSLSGGSWVANGTATTTFGGFGLAVADRDATNVTVGADLYVTTGQGALTANRLVKLVDTAGFNATISIAAAQLATATATTLYTAPTGTILKGVDFAPVAADTTPPTVTSIVDDDADDVVNVNTTVNYTITFNEDINAASVSAADFDNAGTAAISIGAITETTLGFSTSLSPRQALAPCSYVFRPEPSFRTLLAIALLYRFLMTQLSR